MIIKREDYENQIAFLQAVCRIAADRLEVGGVWPIKGETWELLDYAAGPRTIKPIKKGDFGAAFGGPSPTDLPPAALFSTRELAQEMLRQFKRDIPETIVKGLTVVLNRFVETGEYVDDIGIILGKQPMPPLGVQRFEKERLGGDEGSR